MLLVGLDKRPMAEDARGIHYARGDVGRFGVLDRVVERFAHRTGRMRRRVAEIFSRSALYAVRIVFGAVGSILCGVDTHLTR